MIGPEPSRTTRRAFTLIEVSVVGALLALLAAGVVLSVSSMLAPHRQRDAISRVIAFDHRARTLARTTGAHGTLEFDDADASITYRSGAHELVARLPRGASLASPTLLEGRDSVDVGPDGNTPDYAVVIEANDARVFILFAGLTGEPRIMEERVAAESLLKSARTHAD